MKCADLDRLTDPVKEKTMKSQLSGVAVDNFIFLVINNASSS